MNLLVKTILISMATLALLAGSGYFFITQKSTSSSEITKVAKEIETREDTTAPKQATHNDEYDDKNADMKEIQLQIYMHQMTHQKIIAREKRGAVEMTQANIDSLLVIVEENADHYEHADFYESTLVSWQEGDFSNAVDTHNTIWVWHDGSVGRATGLMNAEQEHKFVEMHFR